MFLKTLYLFSRCQRCRLDKCISVGMRSDCKNRQVDDEFNFNKFIFQLFNTKENQYWSKRRMDKVILVEYQNMLGKGSKIQATLSTMYLI